MEEDNELILRKDYKHSKDMFLAKYPDINSSDLDVLLECHAQAAMRGHLPEMRRRWDIMGSFYFVCTLVVLFMCGLCVMLYVWLWVL